MPFGNFIKHMVCTLNEKPRPVVDAVFSTRMISSTTMSPNNLCYLNDEGFWSRSVAELEEGGPGGNSPLMKVDASYEAEEIWQGALRQSCRRARKQRESRACGGGKFYG